LQSTARRKRLTETLLNVPSVPIILDGGVNRAAATASGVQSQNLVSINNLAMHTPLSGAYFPSLQQIHSSVILSNFNQHLATAELLQAQLRQQQQLQAFNASLALKGLASSSGTAKRSNLQDEIDEQELSDSSDDDD
jgi:hypothetical protein